MKRAITYTCIVLTILIIIVIFVSTSDIFTKTNVPDSDCLVTLPIQEGKTIENGEEFKDVIQLSPLQQLNTLEDVGACVSLFSIYGDSSLGDYCKTQLLDIEKSGQLLNNVSSIMIFEKRYQTNIDHLMPIVSECERLRTFDYDRGCYNNGTNPTSPIITDQGLLCLVSLQSLESIRIGSLPVSEDTLAQVLKNKQYLKELDLRNIKFSGETISWNFPNLEYAYLSDTKVNDETLKNMSKCSKLKDIDLSGTLVTNEGLKWFSGMDSLLALILANTSISEELHHVGSLPNLLVLDLNNTNVDDDSLLELVDAPKLERIHLSQTNISNQGIEVLTKLPNLKYLTVCNTRVKDGILPLLKNMPKPCTIILSNACGMPESDIIELRDDYGIQVIIDPFSTGEMQ